MTSELEKKEIDILSQAFESFNQATAKLEESYKRLEERVESLNLELEEKNVELVKNLNEKENVKNYLHDILESLPTGVVVIDPQRKITTFNKTISEIAGVQPDDALGNTFDQIFNLEESKELPLSQILSPESGRHYVEIKFVNRKNEELDLSISSSTMKSPVHGRLEKTLIIQDITEIKRLEQKLERNNRLTAMGEMAAGIAHELRNPLGSIELFSSLLRRELSGNSEQCRIVDHITTGVKKMDHIISGLLVFTRSPTPRFRQYNLHEVIDEVVLFNDLLIRENKVTVVKDFNHANPVGEGDKDLLSQVFTNLILNAVQAMPSGGLLTLSTKPEEGKKGGSQELLNLVIQDSGSGISSSIRSKIFDPFFTTKDRGTGLGLAIVHSIVKAHNGHIEFQSLEKKGTVFTIALPAWHHNES